MPRPRSTVIHVRPEIRRRVHRRRFFRKVVLVVFGAGLIAGTVWQYQETIRPQLVPDLPPAEKKAAYVSGPFAPAERKLSLTARPISTTPIPIAGLTAAPKRATRGLSLMEKGLSPTGPVPFPGVAESPPTAPDSSLRVPEPPPPVPEAGKTTVPILEWFTQLPPILTQLFEDRLATAIKEVGEREITLKYREAEFRDIALQHLRQRFPGQLRDLAVRFKAGAVEGSCAVTVGPVTAPVVFRAGVAALDDRLHVTLYTLRIAAWEVPKPLLALAEARINDAIISHPARLRLTWVRVEPGQLIVSAELR